MPCRRLRGHAFRSSFIRSVSSEKVASAAIFSPKGPWRLSSTSAMHRAFTNRRFKDHGLFSMDTLVGA
jgi:hypothetical protein